MALAKRFGHDQIGSSKKHDAPRTMNQPGPSKLSWSGFRRRRLILVVVAILAIYIFVKNLPTDVVPVNQRYDPRFGPPTPGHIQAQYEVDKTSAQDVPSQDYEGSIQFTKLAASLRPHLSWPREDNVLFALPTLRSTSNLIPFACEMARNNRSTVHVALMGRQEVSVKDILKVNGITGEDCPVYWHDARPDHSLESSSTRIEKSLRTAFSHCHAVLRPQVVLTDAFDGDDVLTGKALKIAAMTAQVHLITLPSNAQQSVPWVTALDGGSLQKFNDIQIDIVIQPYSESAGSLIRLLRSIESANYDSLPYPRITVELPPQVDSFLTNYLTWFKWPPYIASLPNQLILRRRVSSRLLDTAQASLRVIESFYPQSKVSSHVLFLSPDADLSPNYLHYLMFTLLEYKYGTANFGQSNSLFGLSLELPNKKLDGSKPFVAKSSENAASMFLSQTPVSDAVLFMGDKWADFHSFLTQRSMRDSDLVVNPDAAKFVSKDHPAWLAEALNFMQAQGLYTMYPSFAATEDLKLVTLHKELHQTPEEYASIDQRESKAQAIDVEKIMKNDVLPGDEEPVRLNDNTAHTNPFLPMQVLTSDKSSLRVPSLNDMPLYNSIGAPLEWFESFTAAEKFANEFSLQQGGCASLNSRDEKQRGRVEYLFCAPD